MNQHTSKEFERELEDIKSGVLLMGETVNQMVTDAIQGFECGDQTLLKKVLHEEKKVNQLEIDIDDQCSHVLAIRQPTAADMRFLVASIKIIRDLERMGDEAEKMARMAMLFHEHAAPGAPATRISEMSEIVQSMLAKALSSYVEQNSQAVQSILRSDLQVDDHFRNTLRLIVLGMIEDSRTISRGIDLLFFAKALERIGDHSKNLMEHVVYMVEGENLRNKPV